MTLYHGTTLENALVLVEQGWSPFSGKSGANQGQYRYLYVTTDEENALWFAEQNGGSSVVCIEEIDVEDFQVDPEDGIGETVEEEIEKAGKLRMPANFVIFKAIPSSKIKIVKK